MKEFQAVVFDIGGTLAPEISWTSLTRDLGASVDEHIQIYQAYKHGETTYEQSKNTLLALWQDTGNANKAFFNQLFSGWELSAAALGVVRQVAEASPVCIITGSMDMYAQTVAQKLGVEEYFANTALKWNSDGELVDMDYELDQASKKLEQFLGYCLRHNIQPEDTIVVGDGENDIELFKSSGRGVAIGSDIPQELGRVAWREISTIEQLPIALGLR